MLYTHTLPAQIVGGGRRRAQRGLSRETGPACPGRQAPQQRGRNPHRICSVQALRPKGDLGYERLVLLWRAIVGEQDDMRRPSTPSQIQNHRETMATSAMKDLNSASLYETAFIITPPSSAGPNQDGRWTGILLVVWETPPTLDDLRCLRVVMSMSRGRDGGPMTSVISDEE